MSRRKRFCKNYSRLKILLIDKIKSIQLPLYIWSKDFEAEFVEMSLFKRPSLFENWANKRGANSSISAYLDVSWYVYFSSSLPPQTNRSKKSTNFHIERHKTFRSLGFLLLRDFRYSIQVPIINKIQTNGRIESKIAFSFMLNYLF